MPLLLCNCSRMRRHLHASPPAFVFFLFSPSLLWLEDGAFIHPPLFDISAYFFIIIIILYYWRWRWTSSDDGKHGAVGCFCARLVRRGRKKRKKKEKCKWKKKGLCFWSRRGLSGIVRGSTGGFFSTERRWNRGRWRRKWTMIWRLGCYSEGQYEERKKNNNNNNRRFL